MMAIHPLDKNVLTYLISITLSGPDKESENPLLLTCNLTYPLMKANIQLFLAMMKVVPAFPYFFSLSFWIFVWVVPRGVGVVPIGLAPIKALNRFVGIKLRSILQLQQWCCCLSLQVKLFGPQDSHRKYKILDKIRSQSQLFRQFSHFDHQ